MLSPPPLCLCHPVLFPLLPYSFLPPNCYARPTAVGPLVKQILQVVCAVLSLLLAVDNGVY